MRSPAGGLEAVSPSLLGDEGVFVDAPKKRVPFVSLVEVGGAAGGDAPAAEGGPDHGHCSCRRLDHRRRACAAPSTRSARFV